MVGQDQNNSDIIERLVGVRRVAKTTKGGRNMSFAALIVVGNGKGKVGIGYAKAREVPSAATKARQIALRAMFEVPRIQGTIPHPVQGEDAAGVVFLRPASPGTGVIAGGPVRAVLECAGYTDVLTKSLGSSNAINIVHATIAALKVLERPESVAIRRGLPLEDVTPARLLSNITTSDIAGIDTKIAPTAEEPVTETVVDIADKVNDNTDESETIELAKTVELTDVAPATAEPIVDKAKQAEKTKQDVKKSIAKKTTPSKSTTTKTTKKSVANTKKVSTATKTATKKETM